MAVQPNLAMIALMLVLGFGLLLGVAACFGLVYVVVRLRNVNARVETLERQVERLERRHLGREGDGETGITEKLL